MHNKLKNMHAIFIATHTEREQPTLALAQSHTHCTSIMNECAAKEPQPEPTGAAAVDPQTNISLSTPLCLLSPICRCCLTALTNNKFNTLTARVNRRLQSELAEPAASGVMRILSCVSKDVIALNASQLNAPQFAFAAGQC